MDQFSVGQRVRVRQDGRLGTVVWHQPPAPGGPRPSVHVRLDEAPPSWVGIEIDPTLGYLPMELEIIDGDSEPWMNRNSRRRPK